jgi:hypothetical protein
MTVIMPQNTRSAGRNSAKGGPPFILAKIYGEDRVLTLEKLLLHLSSISRGARHLDQALIQALDHNSYTEQLLQHTFCVVNRGAPQLQDGFTLQQTCSQAEVGCCSLCT